MDVNMCLVNAEVHYHKLANTRRIPETLRDLVQPWEPQNDQLASSASAGAAAAASSAAPKPSAAAAGSALHPADPDNRETYDRQMSGAASDEAVAASADEPTAAPAAHQSKMN